MLDYEKLYHKLFNDITKAIEVLKNAHIEAEEMYLEMTDDEEYGSEEE